MRSIAILLLVIFAPPRVGLASALPEVEPLFPNQTFILKGHYAGHLSVAIQSETCVEFSDVRLETDHSGNDYFHAPLFDSLACHGEPAVLVVRKTETDGQTSEVFRHQYLLSNPYFSFMEGVEAVCYDEVRKSVPGYEHLLRFLCWSRAVERATDNELKSWSGEKNPSVHTEIRVRVGSYDDLALDWAILPEEAFRVSEFLGSIAQERVRKTVDDAVHRYLKFGSPPQQTGLILIEKERDLVSRVARLDQLPGRLGRMEESIASGLDQNRPIAVCSRNSSDLERALPLLQLHPTMCERLDRVPCVACRDAAVTVRVGDRPPIKLEKKYDGFALIVLFEEVKSAAQEAVGQGGGQN